MAAPLISVQNVTKVFRMGDVEVRALRGVSLDVHTGEFVAVHNITVDLEGNIYTAEVADGERVQRFRRIDLQN